MGTATRRQGRDRRHRRVRKKVLGTPDRPRLAVYRSNRYTYAQLIDDVAGKTLVAVSSLGAAKNGGPTEQAKSVGEQLATRAKEAGITRCTFDRGGFKYHGRVRAVAEGAREGGLEL